ncbi:MAG: peptidylprolyl isomerase [Candidatus Micrarchaeota archaeon]|nr:peptidylprolyl isomerase [Candidatus Micrarchaeota archaeon]
MVNVQANDLVELAYSAKVEGRVFDTTSESEAKSAGVFNEKSKYGPVLVAVGQKQVIPGLDEALVNAEEGKAQSVSFGPDKAFGARNPDLVRVVPVQQFRDSRIEPAPGLVVELDGRPARIQSVTGGRVRVDFNSDLAGKTVDYSFTVVKVFRTPEDKVQALAKILETGSAKLNGDAVDVSLEMSRDKAADVVLKKFRFIENVFSTLDSVKKINFSESYTK